VKNLTSQHNKYMTPRQPSTILSKGMNRNYSASNTQHMKTVLKDCVGHVFCYILVILRLW